MSDQAANSRARADQISRDDDLENDPAGALTDAGGQDEPTDDVSGYGIAPGGIMTKGGNPTDPPEHGGGTGYTAPQGGGPLPPVPTPPDGGGETAGDVNW